MNPDHDAATVSPALSLAPEEFGAMPLAGQIEALTAALESGDPRELLELTASLRDHAPLAWLATALLERGWLGNAGNQAWFAGFLVARSPTAVDKVLKTAAAACGPGDTGDQERRDALRDVILGALRQVPIRALSSLCILDRALKHRFPQAREAHIEAVRARCARALQEGRPQDLSTDLLAHVRAASMAELAAIARRAGVQEAFAAARAELAEAVIDVLGNAPKAVSQSNAEELLARRVYTDPGHFLIELLQNAEDAGARTWRVVFDRHRLVVWHDGAPFDARDVVGVCSIGQTTKRKDQIGFFGVGFKSVYEVTDRPQIYSDVYRFEIADVSIPKLLRRRPPDLPQEGTVLVLPLRDPQDPVRSAKRLYEKAVALDPCVLLTLRSMDVLDFELTAAAGGPSRRRIREIRHEDSRRRTIVQEPEGTERAFIIDEEDHAWTGAARAAGRADRTPVMVGVAVDESGRACPLDTGAATVYSYLPTAEPSGLRFFVQAHFEVPVDRERITQDSTWNVWILEQVPARIARIARGIAAAHVEGGDRALGEAASLLSVLPLARELPTPIFRTLPRGIREALDGIPILAGADGRLHAPRETLIADRGVAELFAGEPIAARLLPGADSDPGARFLLDPALDERSREVAAELGCATFDAEALVALLERALAAPRGGELPAFLRAPSADRWSRLAEVLLAAVEDEERRGGETLAGRLAALPLVPDDAGTLHPAGSPEATPARAPEELREIYKGLRPFVARELDPLVGGAHSTSRVNDLLDRLGSPRLDAETLVCDLEECLGEVSAPLEDLGTTRLPRSAGRLEQILELLSGAPLPLKSRASALPLFRATDGRYYPGARDLGDRGGVLVTRPGDEAEALREFYGSRRPILAAAERQAGDPARRDAASGARILLHADVPALGIDALVRDLEQGSPVVDRSPDGLRDLHALLESLRDALSGRVRATLARLAIWPDESGTPRPLSGRDAARVPSHKQIRGLFADVPFVDPEIQRRLHFADMKIEPVGLETVIEALEPDASPPLRIEPREEIIRRVQRYILATGERLTRKVRKRLGRLPVFVSERGEVRTLDALCRTSDVALRSLYAGADARHFIDEESVSLARALGLDGKIEEADARMLVGDIARALEEHAGGEPATTPFVGDPERRERLFAYLADAAAGMARAVVERCAKLPIFPDESGRLARLKSAHASEDREGVYTADPQVRFALSALGRPLVDADTQERLQPLLRAAGIRATGLRTMLSLLMQKGADGPPLEDAASLERLHRLLIERRDELAEHYPVAPRDGLEPASPRLCRLRIWPTLGGEIASADRVVPDSALALFDPETPERAALESRTLDDETALRFAALRPLVAPGSTRELIDDLVREMAKDGEPLADQPAFLSGVERVKGIATLLAGRERPPAYPLVSASGRLTFAGLMAGDSETLALVEGLPVQDRLLHAAMRDMDLPRWEERVGKLEPSALLEALATGGVLADRGRRERLYLWLVSHEAAVMTDERSRALLEEGRYFLSSQANLLRARDLVVDADLPDLGIDWTPHPEIPAAALEMLTRHLGIGRPPLAELVERHLRPAYDRAVEARDRERAGELLAYLARQPAAGSRGGIPRLLEGILLEDQGGEFRAAADLTLPGPDLARQVTDVWEGRLPRPGDARYPESMHPFLVSLGVRTEPTAAQVAAVFESGIASPRVALGLAGLLRALHRSSPSVAGALPLASTAWILDGDRRLRRPAELFRWTHEIEALIGEAPELYLDHQMESRLGALADELGFKSLSDVRVDDVVRHIDIVSNTGGTVPFRAYLWMEQGLADGWLDAGTLVSELAHRSWVSTDDGALSDSRRVLGTRALHLFGRRRGYWERGAERCPRLCRLFGIPTEVTVDTVKGFLTEIGGEVERDGDAAVLAKEPALPRMLLAACAFLGRHGASVSRELPVVLANRQESGRRRDASAPSQRLLAAVDPSLFRSDTPTLEALFAGAGDIFLAAPGLAGEREEVEVFLESMQVRRLREAYTVEVDADSGEDTTAACSEQIATLRAVLRSLASVLPRVRLQRAQLDEAGWVFDGRLRPLGAAGAIRAIARLSVRMKLDGVGAIRTSMPAVFDPGAGTLLVDSEVLGDPLAHSTGLAAGLISCIYDGPGESQLVEIVEILLSRRSADAMNAYLDRRHFPRTRPKEDAGDLLLVRLGEVLDFGLDAKLRRRFDVLREADFGAWRSPALGERLAAIEAGGSELMRRAIPLLLEAAGVGAAGEEVTGALETILGAASLGDVPRDLLESSDERTDVELTRVRPKDPVDGASSERVGDSTGRDAAVPSTEESLSGTEAGDSTNSHGGIPGGHAPGATDSPRGPASRPTPEVARAGPERAVDGAPPEAEPSLWARIAGFFGFGESSQAETPLPDWARSNNFAPSSTIGSQLWATPEAREHVAAAAPAASLAFEPRRLPPPYLYAVRTFGARFDPAEQAWTATGLPALASLSRLQPSAHRVTFQGRCVPGTSQLPVPLYGRLIDRPQVLDGPDDSLSTVRRGEAGTYEITVTSGAPVTLRYEVELLEVPPLGPGKRLEGHDHLREPTLRFPTLPQEVREWIRASRVERRDDWENAIAAAEFVQAHYVYDDGFLNRQSVRRRQSRLTPGRGNHHLALLHAGEDARHLGRGICYELNTMVVELLRHLGLPSMVATGWVLDDGCVTHPDHLFALAVVSSPLGPCLLPLDAATGPQGPRRPLEPASRAPGSQRPGKAPEVREIAGAWSTPRVMNLPEPERITSRLDALKEAERDRFAEKAAILRRAIECVCSLKGEEVPAELRQARGAPTVEELQRLREALEGMLPARHLAPALVALLRGEFDSVPAVPPAVRELARLGLAEIQTVPTYRAVPVKR